MAGNSKCTVEQYQERHGKDVRELTTTEKIRTGGFEISGMRFNITIAF